MRKFVLLIFSVFLVLNTSCAFSAPFKRDQRSKALKYEYNVLKHEMVKNKDKDIYNLNPTGYMTVEQYEKASEYKDKSSITPSYPVIEKPSDFKYVPQKLYKIEKYNYPAGSPELSLGEKLYKNKQLNGQGVVSPDYTMLAYPSIYYYGENGGVSSDIFVIPLEDNNDSNLSKIMKANVARRNPTPILSTDKEVDNTASFRSLTPVDFSADSTKLLVKEKLGSSEDGIWETRVLVYDFVNKTSYELPEIRDAISYFWITYMNLNLEEKRWDIYPLGFDSKEPYRIIVYAYAYTGETPVYLGLWSIDYQGVQSRLVSFDRNYVPDVSSNGYKLVEDGADSYQTVKAQEKNYKSQSKYLVKQSKKAEKNKIYKINEDYKFSLKELKADYKEESRNLKKLQSFKGSTSEMDIQEAYEKYLEDQTQKDIIKNEKQINKKQKQIDKINEKLEKFNNSSTPKAPDSADSQ